MEYIQDVFQDAGRVHERISAVMWTDLFESPGEPSNLAVEVLDGTQNDLGLHTTEVSTVHLVWNLDSSHRRKHTPPMGIYDHQIGEMDGEKGLSRELSESKGRQSPQTPRGLVLNGSHRSLILL